MEAVKTLHSCKASRVNEIHPENLMLLDVVGLSKLTHTFNTAWRLETGILGWWFPCLRSGLWLMPGCWI